MGLDFFGVTLAANIEVFATPNPSSKEEKEEFEARFGVAGVPFSGPDGKGLRYDLWLHSQSHPNVPEALRTLSYVQDISVELGMGLNSKVQLVLTPPWEEALVLLNSPLIQWGIGRLNVRFGYSTGEGAQRQSFTFGGILMKPDVKIGNDIVITLNSVGIGYSLNLSDSAKPRSFRADDSPASVIKRVLSDYPSVTTDKIYDTFTAKQKSPKNGHKFFRPIFQDSALGVDKRVLEQGPRNDWWFIWETVRSYGLELLIIDRDIRILNSEGWRAGDEAGREGRVSKRFRLRSGVNPTPQSGKPIFPILSLSSPTGSVWLASGVGRMVGKDYKKNKQKTTVMWVNEKVKGEKGEKTLKSDAKDKSPKRKRKAKAETKREDLIKIIETDFGRASKTNQGILTTAKSRLKGGPLAASSNFPGSPTQALRDHAKGMFATRNHLKGIHIDVQTIGVPNLRPGDIVKVDGFAVKGQKEGIFDGLYGVIEVRHKVGLGGFMTTFKAISDHLPRAFALAMGAAGIKTTGKVPKDKEGKKSEATKPDKISVEPIPETKDETSVKKELGADFFKGVL